MRVRHFVILLIVFFGFQTVCTYAQVTATWTDSTGNWSNPANWSTNTVPNNNGTTTYDVVIDNGSLANTVTFDVNGTVINSLTLRDTLQDSASGTNLSTDFLNLEPGAVLNWTHGGTLTAGGYNSASGTVSVTSSTFTINGDFSDQQGGLTVQSGSMGVSGNMELYQSIGGFTFTNSTLNVGKLLSLGEDSQVVFNNSNVSVGDETGPLGNPFGATLTLNHSNMQSSTVNTGLGDEVQLTQGSTLSVGSISNAGQMDISSSRVNVTNDFSNSDDGPRANISLMNGSSLVVGGTFTNATGNTTASLGLIGAGNSATFGSFHNDAIILVDQGSSFTVTTGGMSNTANGTFTLSGVGNVSGGFTNVGGAVLLNPTAVLTADSYSQSAGSTDISGKLTAGTYTQSGGTTTIETGGKLTAGSFNATGGTVTVNGTLDPALANINFGSGTTLQGTGTIIGSVITEGAVIPGLPGAPSTFTISGNYQQIGSSTLMDLMSPLSQSLLNVTGDVVLGPNSLLQIILLNGFNPLGKTFDVLNYGTLFGQFANGTTFSADGFLWNLTYADHEIEVTAVGTVGTPEPGSFPLLALGLAGLTLFLGRKHFRSRPLAVLH
jgi:hypothetical protein